MVANLMSPAASGSDADVLRSTRNFQPCGAWAARGASATSASTAKRTGFFISDLPSRLDTSIFGAPLDAAAQNRRAVSRQFPAQRRLIVREYRVCPLQQRQP